MRCKVFFYFEQNKSWDKLANELKNNANSQQIITDSSLLQKKLKEKGIDAEFIDDVIPERGDNALEVDRFVKKLFSEYKKIFNELTFHDIKIFEGIEYQFLRQLHILGRTKIILENNKDTTLIFSRFYQVYYVINKLAKQMGYESNSKIYYLAENEIEEISLENNIQNYKNKFSLKRSLAYINSTSSTNNVEKINNKIFLGKKISSYVFKKALQKIERTGEDKIIENTLNKFKKRIGKLDENIISIFFMTASREDLHLKPLKPILKLFNENDKKYLICTSDLSTNLMLKKSQLPFLNIFEEVKLLTTGMRNSVEGKTLIEEFENVIDGQKTTLGITEFSEFLLEEFYRVCAIILLCEIIVKKFHLKSIWTSSDGEMFENISMAVGRKNNIVSYSMIPTAFFPHPLMSEWFHADYIFSYGENGTQNLLNLGYHENKIIQTGHPRYDLLLNLDVDGSKNKLNEQFSIGDSKKIITIAMGMWAENDEIWMSKIIQFCNKKNYDVVIKVHPMYKYNDAELSNAKINFIKNECKDIKFLISDDIDLYRLLVCSDVIITDFSNVGLEALLLDKPLITVRFAREEYWKDVKFEYLNAAISIKEYEELEKSIEKIINSQEMDVELKLDRKRLIELYNYKNDGKASQRIFSYLTNQ